MAYLIGSFNALIWCVSFALACYGILIALDGGILAGALVYAVAAVVQLFRMAPPD